ncbi:MAG: hypothetical protein ACKVYV_08580 [Limisphaerales bacterium]
MNENDRRDAIRWKPSPLMISQPTYCYWSVATGPYAERMERCVASARAAGVFKEFHVMTDRPIPGAESYEAYEVELTDKLFKLAYLKAAISKLNFEYYVWLDADTVFRRNPRNLLGCLSRSPIHIPLEVNLSALIKAADGTGGLAAGDSVVARHRGRAGEAVPEQPAQNGAAGNGVCAKPRAAISHAPFREVMAVTEVDSPHPALHGLSIREHAWLFTAAGVQNPVYWSRSAFWVVRRSAIELVCDLALHFRAFAKARRVTMDSTAGLSYAMQMLCAEPGKHEAAVRADLWFGADGPADGDALPEGTCPITGITRRTHPAIVHFPDARRAARGGGVGIDNHEALAHAPADQP